MIEVNPYKILELSPAASRQEIMQAVATAMKKRKYSASQIASAQRFLMNRENRLIADLLLPILPDVVRFTSFNCDSSNSDSTQYKSLDVSSPNELKNLEFLLGKISDILE